VKNRFEQLANKIQKNEQTKLKPSHNTEDESKAKSQPIIAAWPPWRPFDFLLSFPLRAALKTPRRTFKILSSAV
jgi:hypothetical protein